jgi:hypothetical protein
VGIPAATYSRRRSPGDHRLDKSAPRQITKRTHCFSVFSMAHPCSDLPRMGMRLEQCDAHREFGCEVFLSDTAAATIRPNSRRAAQAHAGSRGHCW